MRISKIVSGYAPAEAEKCAVIGGDLQPQEEPLRLIGTVNDGDLCFEAWEGAGGHVGGETVYVERRHRLVFTGDIYVNLKDFTPEQAEFNCLAPYLMTSVDSAPALAGKVRRAVMDLMDAGEWLVIGGHGAAIKMVK